MPAKSVATMVAAESLVARLPRLSCGTREAGEVLGISENSVINLINAGEIRSFRAGSRRLVAISELERYVAARTAAESEKT